MLPLWRDLKVEAQCIRGQFGSRLPAHKSRSVVTFFWIEKEAQPRNASASEGVHLTRASGDPIGNASHGVYCTRARSVSSPVASGGVSCTRARSVSSINASGEVYLHPCPQCFKRQRQWRSLLHLSWSSSRLQPMHSSLCHKRLQTQRHTYRLSMAPRVEGASRLQLVRRDSVLWMRPGTCLTCRWSGPCVLLWRAWGTSGDARRGERNSWRGLCYISVMSCSRALVIGVMSS